jgi:hypothetical protein
MKPCLRRFRLRNPLVALDSNTAAQLDSGKFLQKPTSQTGGVGFCVFSFSAQCNKLGSSGRLGANSRVIQATLRLPSSPENAYPMSNCCNIAITLIL